MWWGLTGWPPWSSQWVWMNPRYPLDLGEVCSTPSCVCMCEGQVGDTAWSSLCSLLGAMPTQGGQHAYMPTRQAFSPGTMALSAATTPCREPPPTRHTLPTLQLSAGAAAASCLGCTCSWCPLSCGCCCTFPPGCPQLRWAVQVAPRGSQCWGSPQGGLGSHLCRVMSCQPVGNQRRPDTL